MIIYFKTKRLQNTCNNTKEAIKGLGPKMARKLQQRLKVTEIEIIEIADTH